MRVMKNECHIEGRLYDHKLVKKVTGEKSKNPGTEFISGTIDIATDEKCDNVVQIHFTYVTEITKFNKKNATFEVLDDIINNGATVLNSGKESALVLRWDGSIDLNDFPSERNGKEEWISAKRNEGGFIHITNDKQLNEDENKRNTWKTDMVITGVTEMEADPEKNLPMKGIIKGFIFNFRKEVLPVEFVTHNSKALDYFNSLEASIRHPVFTSIWGRQVSQTVVQRIVEESAFGEDTDSVIERTSSRKEYLITGTAKNLYVWDDEDTITAAELKEALANREILLAEKKKQREEYENNRSTRNSSTGTYDF